MDFTGKIAIVTGGAIGIGSAVVRKLAENGAAVFAMDVNEAQLATMRNDLQDIGSNVITRVCDVTCEEQVRSVIAEVLGRYGKVDILVNNAGIWRAHNGPFVNSQSEFWKQKIEVNILGTMYMTHEVLPGMIERQYGKIINLGSVAGVYGNGGMADYSMTKGALIAFTSALAKEVTQRGVLVNAVSPGSVSDDEGVIPSELSFMGRTGSHQENANLICFLASEEASYIAGQNIQIDGCRKKM